MLGSRLVSALTARGDEVVRLVRRPAQAADERSWDPDAGTIASPGLTDVDAVVNLAGASIAGWRWTREYKEKILSSRLATTSTVISALERARAEGNDRCKTFLSASAVGIYGYDLGDFKVTEQTPAGDGFLADVCTQWEGAAAPAESLGVRTVYLRTANVLAPEGGILGVLRLPYLLGLGGRIGNGRQWFSWISAEDHVRAQLWLLDNQVGGPINLSAPGAVRNESFVKQYAHSLRRPAIIPLPLPLVSLVLTKKMVEETIAAGQRVIPERLDHLGFRFKHGSLSQALRWVSERK